MLKFKNILPPFIIYKMNGKKYLYHFTIKPGKLGKLVKHTNVCGPDW